MSIFICPKCRSGLEKHNNSLVCPNGHCFDIAKSGYVNLLMNNRSSIRGDGKDMINSRKNFLDRGRYQPLIDRIGEICGEYCKNDDCIILDAGCGEGKYTERLYENSREKNAFVCGIDISKFAVDQAKKRCKNVEFAVAGLNSIPLEDSSVGLIFNIFAPEFENEFARILKIGGYLIKVIPLEDHLIELKKMIYDNVVKTDVKMNELEHFQTDGFEDIRYRFKAESNEEIFDLFTMTPYYYKTSNQDRKKLENINSLEISASFRIIKYKRI